MQKKIAVLIRDGHRQHAEVGTKEAGALYPYVMWMGDLYVRWEQGDENANRVRIPAYMRADYYDIGRNSGHADDVAKFATRHEATKR